MPKAVNSDDAPQNLGRQDANSQRTIDKHPELTERRYLTIVFCDLVGSTVFSEILDPEELHDLLLRYQHLCTEIVRSYNGVVARCVGDGLLFDFGYPVSHGNDAERAIRASLDILDQLPTIVASMGRNPPPTLSVRIGISTGLVVIGPELGPAWHLDHSIIGKPANIAARIQEAALPNSVLISRDTLDLVEGLFDVEPLGVRTLKGIAAPVPLFKILGSSSNLARNEARFQRGANKMVGRADSMNQLVNIWSKVRAGATLATVQIIGEAGVGKTRLVHEFRRLQLATNSHFIRINCFELSRNTPLFPIANCIRAEAQIFLSDSKNVNANKLRDFLSQFAADAGYPYIAPLLGLDDDEIKTPISPILVKKHLFGALISLMVGAGRSRPTVLCIEDTHWLDPSSTELLREIITACIALPILVLLTSRDVNKKFALNNHEILLNPLTSAESQELAHNIPGAHALPPQVLQRAVEISDGLPLFIEHVIISALDQQTGMQASVNPHLLSGIPPTLAEVLFERLDRFPGAKQVMQAAASFGRSFSAGILCDVLALPLEDLNDTLELLVRAEFLRRRDVGSQRLFEFRHTLLQRACYESMIQATKKGYHSRIVIALRKGSGSGDLSQPEMLAHHLTGAEMFEDAAQAWLKAGLDAVQKSANIEAIEHFRRALEVIGMIRDPVYRHKLAITAHASLIAPLVAVRGYASAEVADSCRRGLELCVTDAASPMAFPFLYAQFTWAVSSGHFAEAMSLAELFLKRTEASSYTPGTVIGYRLLGMSLFAGGKAIEARDALAKSIALYVPQRDDAVTYLFGQNSKVTGQSLLALIHFHLGDVEKALTVGFDTLQIAEEVKHPLSKAIAISYIGGWLAGYLGAVDVVSRQAKRLITLAENYNLGVFAAYGDSFLGWALVEQGHIGQGTTLLESAVEKFRQMGWRLSLPNVLLILSCAKCFSGNYDAAYSLCVEARRLSAEGGERWVEAEALRVEAMILAKMHSTDLERAESIMWASIECARRLKSPTFELRSLLSFSEAFGRSKRADAVSCCIRELSSYPPLNPLFLRELRARARDFD